MNSLPILSLPYLARINIYQYMGYIDLFDLSICSKRMKRILKSELRHKDISLEMEIDTATTFDIQNYRGMPDEKIFVESNTDWNSDDVEQSRNIGNFKNVLSTMSRHSLSTYWFDTFIGAKTVLQELSDIFKVCIEVLTIDMDEFKNNFKEVVEWINSISDLTGEIVFEGDTYNFNDYKWILEIVRTKESVAFNMEPTDYLKVDTLDINVPYLSIEHASWIQMKHILALNVTTMELKHLSLTGKEVNQYLKSIVAGNHPDIELADFKLETDPDMDEMLDGLNFTRNYGMFLEFLLNDGNTCTLVVRTSAVSILKRRL